MQELVHSLVMVLDFQLLLVSKVETLINKINVPPDTLLKPFSYENFHPILTNAMCPTYILKKYLHIVIGKKATCQIDR